MNKTIMTALAVSLAFGVTAAEARGIGPNHPQFSEVDADSNGQISQTELEAIAANRFNEADTNADGFLDADEMKAQLQQMAGKMPENPNGNDRSEQMLERMDGFTERMITRVDENEDGKISLEEISTMKRGLVFAEIDTNADDALSEMEWHVAVEHRGNGDRMQRRAQMRGHTQDRGQMQERGGWLGHMFGQDRGRH